jgi:hypothetical protein
MSKQITHIFHKEGFTLKKLYKIRGKEQICVEISNWLTTWKNLDADVEI